MFTFFIAEAKVAVTEVVHKRRNVVLRQTQAVPAQDLNHDLAVDLHVPGRGRRVSRDLAPDPDQEAGHVPDLRVDHVLDRDLKADHVLDPDLKVVQDPGQEVHQDLQRAVHVRGPSQDPNLGLGQSLDPNRRVAHLDPDLGILFFHLL